MNARHIFSQPRLWAASALLVVAGAANAGVSISVGVHAPGYYGPGVSAVVSNGPAYYAPRPVYVQPPVVVQPRYYGVQPVVYAPPPPPQRFRPFMGWGRWHHGRAEAYENGYRQGYERGYDHGNRDDDRRGGDWGYRR